MTVKAVELKNWTNENITPLAWKRVVLRSLPVFNDHGFELEEVENPSANLELKGALVEHLFSCIYDMYKVEVPGSVLIEK